MSVYARWLVGGAIALLVLLLLGYVLYITIGMVGLLANRPVGEVEHLLGPADTLLGAGGVLVQTLLFLAAAMSAGATFATV